MTATRPQARRIWALVRKEARQVLRDPSSMAIGIVLPVMLILLFGYGLSLDVKQVPIASSWKILRPMPWTWLPDFACQPISTRS